MKNNDSPRLWRSLAEYEQDPEFQKYLENEFATPLTDAPPNSKERRRFMQLMGASFALTGAAGCRWDETKLAPMTRRPEGVIPGVPRYYNTAMELAGVGIPLRVKSYDGRPIKVDGNPDHPDSLGASRIYEQGSVLGEYDPDRSKGPVQFAGGKATPAAWDDFKKFAIGHFRELRNAGGNGLAVLSLASSSATVAAAKAQLLSSYPSAQWFEYEPVNRDNSVQGSKLAFGGAFRTHYKLDAADVIVALDADPLATGAESLPQARAFGATREPELGKMSRLWSVEASLSPTGIKADHRLALRSAQIAAFAVALEAELSKALGVPATQSQPAAAFLQNPAVAKFFAALVKDLVASKGRGVVIVGESQAPEIHALGHRINSILGNVGTTVQYTPEPQAAPLREGLKQLVSKIDSVKTLIILDGNPVYTASADVDFAAALAKVPTSIHLSLYRDETSRRCSWHLPLAHYLEAWGDSKSVSGTTLVAQPLIAPLYGGVSVPEFLAIVNNDAAKDGQELVRRALGVADDKAWERVVHAGLAPINAPAFETPSLAALGPVKLSADATSDGSIQNGKLEVQFVADTRIYDGRFANNGWLQETPEHAMKLTWDNAAFVSPGTAAALGIKDCTLLTVKVGGRSITLPALQAPGQAPGTLKIALGYGRTDAGVVAGAREPEDHESVESVGVNAYAIRTLEAWDYGSNVEVVTSSDKVKLATTQDKHPMDDIGREGTQERMPQLVRQDSFEHYKEAPDHIKHAVHHPPLLSLWYEPVSYEGYKWGMSIDLNKCTGCNSCVVACNAENNIPVVGKKMVLMGRELHWMRIDRYFQGENADEPDQVHLQPVLCQHCEHAPCEQVCPVGATMHSHEGLNEMAYNRCIGTRYCSNNCPYKVRRYNYFNFTRELREERNKPLQMVQNPEVTVRFRGVMEKCSFCVQRIQNAKIPAKNQGRKLHTDEVTSACQDACPTRAIEFGDLNDPKSKVAAKANSPRGYALLQELNVRPRITYLARITNYHPDLAPASAHEGAGAGEHGTEGKTEHHG